MKILTSELSSLLHNEGASLVGFGDISALDYQGFTSCVALAVKIPAKVIAGIKNGPTRDYFDSYHELNARLNALAELAAKYLSDHGHRALPQTTTTVVESPGYRTPVPHKTCATRAGLGWIGKSALLVTEEYGPALRLSSVLTDAEFDSVSEPINVSRCGSCTACASACPGQAIKGALWDVNAPRESLVDVEACRKAARALAADMIGEQITLCGKCIETCPYTRAYLKKENVL